MEDFFSNCEAGLSHAQRDEFWQAGNRFNEALQLWKGTLPSDTFRNDSIYAYEDTLVATFEKMSLTWARILADAEWQKEAISILIRLLRTNPLAEEGIILLCRLYGATYQPLKIRETLEGYRKALQNVEYEKDEIDEMIEGVVKTLEE